jgi:putative FmdB family regulatory protein
MPAYEYSCIECDIDYIKNRGITEQDPGYWCDKCGNRLNRVYSKVGVQFNGKGFYTTDYGKK